MSSVVAPAYNTARVLRLLWLHPGISRSEMAVQLRVHDDGRGAVEKTLATGFGLRGIRERAEQLKGRASYSMAPDEGFTLDVELPA